METIINILFVFIAVYMIIASVCTGIFLGEKFKPFPTTIISFLLGWLIFPALLGSYIGHKFIDADKEDKI